MHKVEGSNDVMGVCTPVAARTPLHISALAGVAAPLNYL